MQARRAAPWDAFASSCTAALWDAVAQRSSAAHVGRQARKPEKVQQSAFRFFFAGRLKQHPWRATRRSEKGCLTPTPKQELFGQDLLEQELHGKIF